MGRADGEVVAESWWWAVHLEKQVQYSLYIYIHMNIYIYICTHVWLHMYKYHSGEWLILGLCASKMTLKKSARCSKVSWVQTDSKSTCLAPNGVQMCAIISPPDQRCQIRWYQTRLNASLLGNPYSQDNVPMAGFPTFSFLYPRELSVRANKILKRNGQEANVLGWWCLPCTWMFENQSINQNCNQ